MNEYVALVVFGLVYVLLIGRRRFGIPIWTAMLIGASLMLVLQVITVEAALASVNLEVIGFLFGMFSIVSALDRAGVLQRIAIKMFAIAKTPGRLLIVFVVGMGLLAAFLVNDTIALLGVPIAIHASKYTGIRLVVWLLALAFGVSVGSIMTPIGNPQNLLIAIQSGIPAPFITFLMHLAPPTIVSLFVTYSILRMYYKKEISSKYNRSSGDSIGNTIEISGKIEKNYDPHLAKISTTVLIATIAGFIISDVLHVLKILDFSLSAVAMIGATAIYAMSN